MSSVYPYTERYDVLRGMPSEGRPRDAIREQLAQLAAEEDQAWESGQCSGTMYCGDHEHYDFMGEVYKLFAHVNVLQRDICPSATKFEGEIIAMTLDMLHGDDVIDTEPGGLVTSGGSDSILHAMYAYREHVREHRQINAPNVIKAETGHAAFDKACHLLGIELRVAPVDPVSTKADVDWVRDHIDGNTIALVGSACNYGYGTIDPIEELGQIALERGIGLHVDGCLGGFILPWGQQLGYDIPTFDFRIPGVTTISADTHKYGYGFKGTSVLAVPRHRPAPRPVLLPHRLERRQVLLTRHRRQPFGWAPRCDLGLAWSASGARATCATPRRSSRRPSPCRTRSRATPS